MLNMLIHLLRSCATTALAVLFLGIGLVSAQDVVLPQALSDAARATETEDSESTAIEPIDSTQGFALFEDIESTASSRSSRSPSRPSRGNRATTAEPEFTLVGTTRIGNQYSVMLRHKGGDTLLVKADPEGNTQIPDHSGYAVVNLSPGSVSIRYPGSTPCVEFSEHGVKCNSAGNIAELVLANGEPLSPTVATRRVQNGNNSNPAGNGNGGVAGNGDQNTVVNPFAALRARGNAPGSNGEPRSSNNGNFTPRRIADEDVPPGMRKITTPFGDRLVDQ